MLLNIFYLFYDKPVIPYWHVVSLAGCQGSQTAAASLQTTLYTVSERGTIKIIVNNRQHYHKIKYQCQYIIKI